MVVAEADATSHVFYKVKHSMLLQVNTVLYCTVSYYISFRKVVAGWGRWCGLLVARAISRAAQETVGWPVRACVAPSLVLFSPLFSSSLLSSPRSPLLHISTRSLRPTLHSCSHTLSNHHRTVLQYKMATKPYMV